MFKGTYELVLDRVQLCFEHVVLLRQFEHALFEDHVVEAALFSGPLCGLVIATTAVPVGIVLLVVGDEFALFALGEEVLALHGGG